MELEVGLKLTRVADEFTSDFHISKDRAGPLFLSRETEAMFTLTAHLNGYKRGNLKIDINEDGTIITVSGERQVKEIMMVGWKVYKDTETKSFKKAFKIPATVNLDKIKAKYNDDVSALTISMPKKVKGIQGIVVEEVKEVAELAREGSGNLQIWDEKATKIETSDQENNEMTKSGQQGDGGEIEVAQEEMPENETESVLGSEGGDRLQDEVHENDFQGRELTEETNSSPSKQSNVSCVETETPKLEFANENAEDDTRKRIEPELDHTEPLGTMQVKNEGQTENDQIQDEESESHTQEEEVQEAEAEAGRGEEGEPKRRSKRCKMCTPIVAAGSAVLMSFVIFIIHIVRSKNQTSKRKD